jgi:hypothetical protein
MEHSTFASESEQTQALHDEYRARRDAVWDTQAAFYDPDNPKGPALVAKEQAADALAALIHEHGIRAIPDDFNQPHVRS